MIFSTCTSGGGGGQKSLTTPLKRDWGGVSSDPLIGAKGAEKWQLLETFGKFGLSDPFLAPQAPKILRNLCI